MNTCDAGWSDGQGVASAVHTTQPSRQSGLDQTFFKGVVFFKFSENWGRDKCLNLIKNIEEEIHS